MVRALRTLLCLVLIQASCAPSDELPEDLDVVTVVAVPSTEPASIHLSTLFTEDSVEGELPPVTDLEVFDWRFDRPWVPIPEPEEPESGDAEDAPPKSPPPMASEDAEAEDPVLSEPGVIVHGAEALMGVEDLAVEEKVLTGRTVGDAVLVLPRVPEGEGQLHGVEVRLRVSAGTNLGVLLGDDPKLDRKYTRQYIQNLLRWPGRAAVVPGDEFQTILVPVEGFGPRRLSEIRRVYLHPTDAVDATFAVESVRLISEREHLAGQAANMDWRGLGEVYRQTLMMHATETVHFEVSLPSKPWMDLAVGTLKGHPTTFEVHLESHGDDQGPVRLLRRTVTRPDRWEEVPLDLSEWAGFGVRLSFSVRSDHAEQIGFFGTPVVRNREAPPVVFDEPVKGAPQGVIVILADTLRRDHLDVYGYARETAPFLAGLARDGALFKDTITQGTWTKVSVPSILTSLYPTSNGVTDANGKLPLDLTTLAEVFQEAGYATMATSSVPFSGKASNLQQGVDVLHEVGSVEGLEHDESKNAREYVDRVAGWVESHQDQPFFVFLHVFDPHSPFEPYDPYAGVFAAEDARKVHEEELKRVQEHFKDTDEDVGDLPDLEHLEQAGVSVQEFVAREKAWYDESIRAMDAEMARLMERLEDLGLKDRTLLVFTSDHGEEFLEHGRHFHGNTPYGEMTNVPLMMWGPDWVPPGTVVPQTVQSIDLYPTLVELCGLPTPEQVQGQSLVPLVRGGEGFQPRPAFTERHTMGFEKPEDDDIGAYSMVSEGFRLVHNVVRPEGHPEYELYEHVKDPLNLTDIATEHPERVAKMARELELWLKWAQSRSLARDGEKVELSEEELAGLAGLGYVK